MFSDHIIAFSAWLIGVIWYVCRQISTKIEREDFVSPKRILTTTMRVENGFLPLIPVRSDKPIPKDKLGETLEMIAKTQIKAPIKMGDKLIENI